MPAFAEPFWLLGLAAVAVPIAIHLRGERAGRVVRVGSVRWLYGAPAAWVPARKVRRIPLLLLRCAVLVVLSLALARPYLRGAGDGVWVLVAPEVASRVSLDSLRRLGGVRLLAVGLPSIDRITLNPTTQPTDVWSLLREADAAAPAGVRLVVVAPGTVAYLRGVRPELNHQVEYVAVPSDSAGPAERRTGGPVTIYFQRGREDDAHYLALAFRAAAMTRGVAEPVSVQPAAQSLPDVATPWVAWLGGSRPRDAIERWLAQGSSILTDGDTAAMADGDRVTWRGQSGEPLLVARADGRGVHYRLHGRFHPSTLPAVLRPEFADWVDTLWAPSPLRAAAPALPVSARQRTPRSSSGSVARAGHDPEAERRTAMALLLLATLLWVTERALVSRERSA
jgi:hypothetical protein